ncbi:MAG: hypothetical protein ACREJM_05180, partial [Candidatus Saccharimonadales bacterium]
LWVNQHGRLIDWRHKLVSWQNEDRSRPPKRNGNTLATGLSASELILHQAHLKRVEAEMSEIRGSYDSHVSWSAEDSKKFRELTTRQRELVKTLGMVV